jgi:Holliday junction resolvase RusA-like endonuclease
MILVFRFSGNTPSKKNQKRIVRRKGGGAPFILSSKDHERWHGAAVLQMNLQRSAYATIRFPLPRIRQVVAKLYFKDHRRRDTSNTFESIMDLLVDAGVLADDCWTVVGPTLIYPFLRPEAQGGAGWEIALFTFDPAPGRAQEHRNAPPPEAPRA